MNFGINLSFSVKRWPEPEIWAKMVKESMGVDQIQFTLDLLDPWTPEPMFSSMANKISQAALKWGINIESVFPGLAAYTFNNLLHPSPEGRKVSIEWWKRAVDLTAKIGAEAIGGPLGGMSVVDAANPEHKKYLYEELLKNISEITKIAKSSGIKRFLVECTPLNREIPYTIEQAKKLVTDLEGRCEIPFKYLIDVGHALYQPLYGKGACLDKWLTELNQHIGAFHIQNTDFQSDSHWGWPDNRGLFDVQAFARQLKSANLQSIPAFLEVIYPFEMDDERVKSNIISSVKYCKEKFI